jgi:hypothetical protein
VSRPNSAYPVPGGDFSVVRTSDQVKGGRKVACFGETRKALLEA